MGRQHLMIFQQIRYSNKNTTLSEQLQNPIEHNVGIVSKYNRNIVETEIRID